MAGLEDGTHDLLSLVAPPSPSLDEHLNGVVAMAHAAPLGPRELLEFGYGQYDTSALDDEEYEALTDWFEMARERGLASLIRADESAGLAWAVAALSSTWTLWRPVIESSADHDVAAVEAQVATATDPEATRDALESACLATSALPKRGPPPPYVGHFYGALADLLDGRLAIGSTRHRHLASSLSFAFVAPEGSRHSSEIAALRLGSVLGHFSATSSS